MLTQADAEPDEEQTLRGTQGARRRKGQGATTRTSLETIYLGVKRARDEGAGGATRWGSMNSSVNKTTIRAGGMEKQFTERNSLKNTLCLSINGFIDFFSSTFMVVVGV